MNIILFREGEHVIKRNDERFNHIIKVLKLSEGDSFKAGLINDVMGKATIIRLTDDEMTLSFDFKDIGSTLYDLTAIIAQVRPICMKRILREAVSLGIRKLILPVSDLGEKSYLQSSLYNSDEYKEILIDGAMQAGFTGIPECYIVPNLERSFELIEEGEHLLLDNVIGAEPLSSLNLVSKSVTLAIGPERGWSARERALFLSKGFSPCLLGSRILRTETASVAGISIALSRMGML